MAEIKIEKKKPIWPWILLLVILAIAAVLYFMNADNVDDDAMENDDIESVDDMESDDMDDNADIDQSDDNMGTTTYGEGYSRQEADRVMMDYRTSLSDSTKIGDDANYTLNTLNQLRKAVAIKSKQFNVNAAQTLDSLEMKLKPMDNASGEGTGTTTQKPALNSSTIKDAAMQIVGVMQTIQLKEFPNLSDKISGLQQNLGEIKNDMTLAQQKSKVNRFLNNAADVLNEMN